MADAINLTSSVYSTLLTRKTLFAVEGQSTRRLASGYKVGSVTDNANTYLQAQSLTDRIGTLKGVKDGIGQGISALQATQAGTQAIGKLTDQLNGILASAKTATGAQKADLAQQFDTVRNQITALANDTTYQGISLIGSSAKNLDVTTTDSNKTQTIQRRSSDSSSLAINSAASYNNFASSADISAAQSAVTSATDQVRANEAAIASNAASLQVSEQFNQNLSNTLQTGADKLTLANTTAEAARLTAANARDQLAVQSQRIAGQSDRFIANLISGSNG